MEGDDVEKAEEVEEALAGLTLELDRVNEFEADAKIAAPIIDQGVEWQMNQFENMTMQEMREIRRYFSGAVPKVSTLQFS